MAGLTDDSLNRLMDTGGNPDNGQQLEDDLPSTAEIDTTLASAYGGLFVLRTRVIYDQMAGPVFPPPPDPPPASITSKLAGVHSSAIVIRYRVVYDQTSKPVFPPAAVVVTPPFYHSDQGPTKRKPARPLLVVYDQLARPEFPPAVVVVAPPFYSSDQDTARRSKFGKPLLIDSNSAPVIPTAPPPPNVLYVAFNM